MAPILAIVHEERGDATIRQGGLMAAAQVSDRPGRVLNYKHVPFKVLPLHCGAAILSKFEGFLPYWRALRHVCS
jgi:hypothetical protein